MACTVCLGSDGDGMQACACKTRIHTECLAGLLEHGFTRCRVCLQAYTPTALLAAARYKLGSPAVFGPLIRFCSSASTAGHTNESLAILAMLPASTLADIDLAQFLFERGRILQLQGRLLSAENNLQHSLRLLRGHPERSVQPRARTLMTLADVQIGLNSLNAAAQSLHEAVLLTRRLPAEVAEGVMRTVAKYCLARGDVRQHAMALKTINDIVREECPCPVGRAVAFLEMKIGEEAAFEEVTLAETVRSSLKTLRRNNSHPELIAIASKLYRSPKKRCRSKTHAEDV